MIYLVLVLKPMYSSEAIFVSDKYEDWHIVLTFCIAAGVIVTEQGFFGGYTIAIKKKPHSCRPVDIVLYRHL